ncbi:hypothetical protein GCM10009426_02430 [Rheinheimera tangshanensis]|nr:hypothetical protein GCM10010920_02270 [Rheinheimera tangshanensis]
MPILEDDVKRAMEAWLKAQGYSEVVVRLGTRQGYDVEAKDPVSGKLLVIECKGEASTGDQLSRSWPNVAYAMLTALNETENPQKTNEVGLALPDTNEYRDRMFLLQDFCKKQKISVFWVAANGQVARW